MSSEKLLTSLRMCRIRSLLPAWALPTKSSHCFQAWLQRKTALQGRSSHHLQNNSRNNTQSSNLSLCRNPQGWHLQNNSRLSLRHWSLSFNRIEKLAVVAQTVHPQLWLMLEVRQCQALALISRSRSGSTWEPEEEGWAFCSHRGLRWTQILIRTMR